LKNKTYSYKKSYKYHNGFVNFVFILGKIIERKTTKDNTSIVVYNESLNQSFKIIVPFKLSWLKYSVGIHVSTVSSIIPVLSSKNKYLIELKLKNINVVTMEDYMIVDRQQQQKYLNKLLTLSKKIPEDKPTEIKCNGNIVELSGFIGEINYVIKNNQLCNNKLEVLLLQEYVPLKRNNETGVIENNNKYLPIIINGDGVKEFFLKLYVGQPLFIKGVIHNDDNIHVISVIPKNVQEANISELNNKNSHIVKIPEWFQFFYKDYNLNELSVAVNNTSVLMSKYSSRLKNIK
jgi:hypothetical protein